MGDFDKNQPTDTPANAKRKQILMGVLGAVLLVAVGFHFLKGSPEAVSAGPPPGNGPDMAPERPTRTATEELRDLVSDPTANLLQGTPALDPKWSDPPHDPFLLSERFREHPKAIDPQVDPAPVVTHHPLSVAQAPSIPANSLKIEGIFHVGSKLQAIVNGSIVTIGMTVGDALIVDIQDDRVIVRHKDWPAGPTTTITLQSKSK